MLRGGSVQERFEMDSLAGYPFHDARTRVREQDFSHLV